MVKTMRTNKALIIFFRNHSLLTFLLIVLVYSSNVIVDFRLPANTITIFGFYYFIVAVFHYGLSKANEKKAGYFVRFFMMATFFKLLIYFGFLLLLITIESDQSISIIVLFFILYLVYTIFEIVSFLGQISSSKSSAE